MIVLINERWATGLVPSPIKHNQAFDWTAPFSLFRLFFSSVWPPEDIPSGFVGRADSLSWSPVTSLVLHGEIEEEGCKKIVEGCCCVSLAQTLPKPL